MIPLTDIEKSQLKHLITSREWLLLERMQEYYLNEKKKTSYIADSEWETIKRTLETEGRIQGVKEFLEEIMKLAQND